MYKLTIVLVGLSCQLSGKVDKFCIPQMDAVYNKDFGKNLPAREVSFIILNNFRSSIL
jgi:hypothetical protein